MQNSRILVLDLNYLYITTKKEIKLIKTKKAHFYIKDILERLLFFQKGIFPLLKLT
jgi:hypothetical protein